MNLILWRHAEAEAAKPGQSDWDRALTAKGRKQAAQMADWLRRYLPEDARLYASPTRRTCETIEQLGKPYVPIKSLGPEASPENLLNAAGWSGNSGSVLITGHQPALGNLAAQLLSGQLHDVSWPFRKGSVWWFRSRIRNAKLQVQLIALQDPEFL